TKTPKKLQEVMKERHWRITQIITGRNLMAKYSAVQTKIKSAVNSVQEKGFLLRIVNAKKPPHDDSGESNLVY
ncbi:hypothetical protein WA026_008055, partial [Henosepilachna vigintioctopunctata]